MRQVNFIIIFVICLALVLFGIENTEPAVIHLVKGIEFQAPLSIELIMAMGIGAVFAWVFSVWTGLQGLLESRQVKVKMDEQEQQIQQLELDIEQYKAEIQEQRQLLPAAKSLVAEAEAS
jgi:uncharacterized integral membrane protein